MQMDEAPKPRRAISPLFILLAWILFTLGVFALGYPRVRQAVVSSGVLQYARIGEDSPLPSTQVRTVQVSFITASGEQQLVSLQTKRLGGSQYHDSYEALLKGPTREVLSSGLVSYINPGTSLIGVTLSNKILFVDVSKDFLDSLDIVKATEQMKTTALAFSQVKDLVILVEGKPLEQ
ncbi:GerMN domain-containing protein [uncultured Sphaerochaeta sp.]|uniref:GerMN domain-containing protein n=1 Tax=uncultured Sphaerochaeta sp. TaxID=886478 RepID=UPI002A0A1C32|nr:GerMN domain-containing protein [uncultured Sphaerochaeta sp.]